MKNIIFYCVVAVLFTAGIFPSCKDGEDGKSASVIPLGDNCNWYIDGKDTGVEACGDKGDKGEKGDQGDKGGQDLSLTLEIKDGYWWINGKDTGIWAGGCVIAIGSNGNWYINGVDTGWPASGNGATVTQEVNKNDMRIKYVDGSYPMPLPFPNEMNPEIPEEYPAALDLGHFGRGTLIVIPDEIPDDIDGQLFSRCVDRVRNKIGNATVIRESELLTTAYKDRHILVFGLNNSTVATEMWQENTPFLNGIKPYGYRIKMVDRHPFREDGKVVLALGRDWKGAASAAMVMFLSIRQQVSDMENIIGWPVTFPVSTTIWLPFEARYTLDANAVVLPSPLPAMPPVPKIPYGVRVWGMPMQSLESWQRLLRTAKKMNCNSVIVQSGGWVDLENPGEYYKTAMDIAQAEGIYVTMYVGNEKEGAHQPEEWNENYPEIINAIKNHPALLHLALYNQLTALANMNAGGSEIVKKQAKYILDNTNKSIDMEVCGDHNNHPFAAAKIELMRFLKEQCGVEIISTDVAPIGGWTTTGDFTIWETRVRTIQELGLIPMSVLQAHIPNTGPEIPTEADLHLQFWLNVAAGSQGFYYEAANVPNHYSIRGLMTWMLNPVKDGRAEAVRETLGYLNALEPVLLNTTRVDDPGKVAGLKLEGGSNVLMRMRTD